MSNSLTWYFVIVRVSLSLFLPLHLRINLFFSFYSSNYSDVFNGTIINTNMNFFASLTNFISIGMRRWVRHSFENHIQTSIAHLSIWIHTFKLINGLTIFCFAVFQFTSCHSLFFWHVYVHRNKFHSPFFLVQYLANTAGRTKFCASDISMREL